MKYKITINMEIDSTDFIKPPKSVNEIKNLVHDMIKAWADWPKVKIKVIHSK